MPPISPRIVDPNLRLYDISTRLAAYVEAVKLSETRQFNKTLEEVNRTLAKTLGKVKYETMDGLSKAKLNKLLADLRQSQLKIYSRYTKETIKRLQDFMRVDLEVNRRVWATANYQLFLSGQIEDDEFLTDEEQAEVEEERDAIFGLAPMSHAAATEYLGDEATSDHLWASIASAVIPATGVTISETLDGFVRSAVVTVEKVVRIGAANKQTPSQVLKDAENQLGVIDNQNTAVIQTTVGQVGNEITSSVTNLLYALYRWLSVMDSRTTEICISRNLKIYEYGKGPVPPAHIRCRSHIMPVDENAQVVNESFYKWLKNQPNRVQNDLIGRKAGEALRNNQLDGQKLIIKPMSVEDFKKSVDNILSRKKS